MARADQYMRISKEPKTFPDYGKGKCFYCGKPLVGQQRKYCCWSHGWKYRFESRDYEVVNWAGLREWIFKRDNFQCQDCGERCEEAHHIIPVSDGGEEYNIDNCISLCKNCHLERHRDINAIKATDKLNNELNISNQQRLDNY